MRRLLAHIIYYLCIVVLGSALVASSSVQNNVTSADKNRAIYS